MKKSIAIFFTVFIVFTVFIAIALFNIIYPASPFHAWYGKQILSKDLILSKLQVENYCTYYGPTFFGDSPQHAMFVCIPPERVARSEQNIKTTNLKELLESNGWKPFGFNNDYNINYRKGNLFIEIKPYNLEPGYTGDNYKLRIIYQLL